MTLKNFEEYIEDKILQRGHDYFLNGYVSSLEHDGEEWIAEVSGSELYIVSVTLSNAGEILNTDCDCPYDWGPFCKHQAAVFYALRDRPNASEQPRRAAKKPKETLDVVLRRLDKEALLSILLEYAAGDRQMEEALIFRFSKEKDTLKYAKSLIKSSIKAATRRGFVGYANARDATEGAFEALRIVEDTQEEVITRAAICVLVLEEMMRLLEFCDDSDGHVGGAICEAISFLSHITRDLLQSHPNAEKLFSVIFGHARASMYDGWSDWRMDILSACVDKQTATLRACVTALALVETGEPVLDENQENNETAASLPIRNVPIVITKIDAKTSKPLAGVYLQIISGNTALRFGTACSRENIPCWKQRRCRDMRFLKKHGLSH